MTTPRNLLVQSLAPRCPRCEKGKLLSGLLGVQDSCSECGLAFKFHDSGDGPIFFAVTIVGILITAAAAIVEFRYQPPMWLHAALWLPLTMIACVGVLRAFKAALIMVEYRTGGLRQAKSEPEV